MKTHYVLIDYENVQPKEITLLRDAACKVKVFVGPNQGKIPVGLAVALHALGSSAEYVLLETAGPNALDFHIAYYIGRLSAQDPAAAFHIISKDSGFDSLVKHLTGKGILVTRSTCIASMPGLARLPSIESQIDAAIKDLIRRAATRPRTRKTLLSTLNALFRKQLSEPQLLELLDALCKQGVVNIDGTKVTYQLQDSAGSAGIAGAAIGRAEGGA